MSITHNPDLTEDEIDAHVTAWADTGNSYAIGRKIVLRCLWCDWAIDADTEDEAAAVYHRDHFRHIIDRLDEQEMTNGAPAETGAPPRH